MNNQQYRISYISILEKQAVRDSLGLLFGIGVSAAETRSKIVRQNTIYTPNEIQINNNKQQYNQLDNSYPPYSPDADPSNGFAPSPTYDGAISLNLIGMPVLCHLEIIGGTYVTLQGATINVPYIDFQNVVIQAKYKKIVQKTAITGRYTGTVKESIGIDDWQIEIKAIITADAPVSNSNQSYGIGIERLNALGVYPYGNMNAIWQMIQAPIALPIRCSFLDQFSIHYIVIEDFDLQMIAGEYSMQRLSISAVSDQPLIVTLANNS